MQRRENLVSDIPLNLASDNHSLKTHSISTFSTDNRPPPPSEVLPSPPRTSVFLFTCSASDLGSNCFLFLLRLKVLEKLFSSCYGDPSTERRFLVVSVPYFNIKKRWHT
ncbi:uncharacterized protein LOC110276357 isoform X2 [Arachis duranensis]|uniref:Uncharacterized protein LOC110276357 isoform X2 n=1 Tax=Arachis duranensis TaxID=130453 RepID=A0A9C6T7L9_ARADU|nr:uncharacterized protein LOC110276357 isoform X2 [Arachis duranensis]